MNVAVVDTGTLNTKGAAYNLDTQKDATAMFPSIHMPMIDGADISRANPLEVVQIEGTGLPSEEKDQWWVFGDTTDTHGKRDRMLHMVSRDRYLTNGYKRNLLYTIWRLSQQLDGEFVSISITLPGEEYIERRAQIASFLYGKYKVHGVKGTKPFSFSLTEKNLKVMVEGAPTGWGIITTQTLGYNPLYTKNGDTWEPILGVDMTQLDFVVVSCGFYTATLTPFTKGKVVQVTESNPNLGMYTLINQFVRTSDSMDGAKIAKIDSQVRGGYLENLGHQVNIVSEVNEAADALLRDILNWTSLVIERNRLSPSWLILTGGTAEFIGQNLSVEHLRRIGVQLDRIPANVIKMRDAWIADAHGALVLARVVEDVRRKKKA